MESKFVDLRTEMMDLEGELDAKSEQEEEWAHEKAEWEKEREDKDVEVRIWKTRAEQLEREIASRNLNGKAVLNDNDLVYRCLWRPRDSDSACESVFLSTQVSTCGYLSFPLRSHFRVLGFGAAYVRRRSYPRLICSIAFAWAWIIYSLVQYVLTF